LTGAVEIYAGITISTNAAANIAKGYNYGVEESSSPIVVKEEDKIP
jgi:hypothetical protein